MAFCAWCGNPVAGVSYVACPRCGNPTNGSQRVAGSSNSGASAAGIVIVLIVGGLVLVAFIGIIAAIAIPNFVTATQRSKQKRSLADLRLIGTAVEAYATDEDKYPDPNELSSALVPKYMAALPAKDGWEEPYRYECWPAGECRNYAVASAGSDRTFERESLQEYTPETKTTTFTSDIVYANGQFVQYPEGVQH